MTEMDFREHHLMQWVFLGASGVIVALLAYQCHGDDSSTKVDPEAEALAKAAQLGPDDVASAGWSPRTAYIGTASMSCRPQKRPSLADVRSSEFQNGDRRRSQNRIIVFADSESARQAQEEYGRFVLGCDRQTMLKEYNNSVPLGYYTSWMEAYPFDFPAPVDEALGYRIAFDMEGPSTFWTPGRQRWIADYLLLRVGRVVSIVYTMESLGPGDPSSTQLMVLAAQKLRQAVGESWGAVPTGTAPAISPVQSGTGLNRENAAPRGTGVVTAGGLEITVLDYAPDGWPLVQARDDGNFPPVPGYRMALVKIRIKDVSRTSIDSLKVPGFSAVDSEGVVWSEADLTCGVVPQSPTRFDAALPPGWGTEGYVCIQVPQQESHLILSTNEDDENARRYWALE